MTRKIDLDQQSFTPVILYINGKYWGLYNIREKINDLVVSLDGSISAEHGIGRFKREDMYKYTDPTKISLMKSIKDIFDPNSILNPGSIFLDSEPRN